MESALKTWLIATGDAGLRDVAFNEVDCNDAGIDLRLFIGSVKEIGMLCFATAAITLDKSRYIQEIYFASEFEPCSGPSEGNKIGTMLLQDLSPRWACSPKGLRNLLHQIHAEPNMSIQEHEKPRLA